jgi:acylpyruvate hydrolase
MNLVSYFQLSELNYATHASPRLGVLEANSVIDLNNYSSAVPADFGQALRSGVNIIEFAKNALVSNATRIPLTQVQLASPLANPGKTICLGLNYYDHAAESGREKPEYPWFFLRASSSLINPEANGVCPKISERFDYEAELAVIIGQPARHMNLSNALDCVFGYSCFNDMSVRDYQKKTPQWTIGKNFDGTGAFGPVLVTADALPLGAKGLRIQTRLNSVVMQDANTSDMIWDVAETIVLLSECMRLEPGDLIIMGTPAGVGQARKPPVWMKDGDVVEIEIESIGTLRNPIIKEV